MDVTKDDLHKAIEHVIEPLASNLVALAQAVNEMNKYTHRMPIVEAICNRILQPDPALTQANECLAEITAAKHRIGRVKSVTVDWDAAWSTLVTVRGVDGFCSLGGFDVRPGTHGRRALERAMIVLDLEGWSLPEGVAPTKASLDRFTIWQDKVVEAGQ